MNILWITAMFILSSTVVTAQRPSVYCKETERRNDDGNDPIMVKTCFYRDFKFVSTGYPDYAGRYVYYEREVYVRVNNKYRKTTNNKAFNEAQGKLVALVNKRIKEDFDKFSTDTTTQECLIDVQPPPIYKMNDFEISFDENTISFEVHWGLPGACRAVDGTIVSFKLDEIRQYLK